MHFEIDFNFKELCGGQVEDGDSCLFCDAVEEGTDSVPRRGYAGKPDIIIMVAKVVMRYFDMLVELFAEGVNFVFGHFGGAEGTAKAKLSRLKVGSHTADDSTFAQNTDAF